MRAFFGGQIKKKCRGDLVTIIKLPKIGDKQAPLYSTFLYPMDSEEFVDLTGMMDVSGSLKRVYLGISNETGKRITRYLVDMLPAETILRNVDESVVIPHFLDKYPEAPREIILRNTSEGYKVVEEKD